MTTKEIYSEQLEKMIDTITLPQVLELIADICEAKGQHIAENWQDEPLAKLWFKNAANVAKLSPKIYS